MKFRPWLSMRSRSLLHVSGQGACAWRLEDDVYPPTKNLKKMVVELERMALVIIRG